MVTQEFGKWLIIIGILMTVIGTIIYFFNDYLGFVGRLPGDIRIEKENFKFYFPITTMILISLAINLIFRLINRL